MWRPFQALCIHKCHRHSSSYILQNAVQQPAFENCCIKIIASVRDIEGWGHIPSTLRSYTFDLALAESSIVITEFHCLGPCYTQAIPFIEKAHYKVFPFPFRKAFLLPSWQNKQLFNDLRSRSGLFPPLRK